jgi:hypothetical protein
MSTILEAIESAAIDLDGEQYVIQRGKTHIDSDHPLAESHRHLFQEMEGNLTFSRNATADATPGSEPIRTTSNRGAKEKTATVAPTATVERTADETTSDTA